MDVFRFALIGAIAFTVIVLMTRWQDFTAVDVDISAPVTAQTAPAPTNLIPDAPPSDDTAGSVPDEELVKALDQQQAQRKVAATPALAEEVSEGTNIISVLTDSLDLRIDLSGGDIIYAALPKHLDRLDNPDQPFVLMNRNNSLYYIAQSGLIGKNATDTSAGRPTFVASQNEYVMADDATGMDVVLSFDAGDGVTINKIFSFAPGSYLVKLSYQVNNQSSEPWQARLYTQSRRDNSRDPGADTGGMSLQPYLGFATKNSEDPYIKLEFGEISEKPYKADVVNGWFATVQHYFVSAWIAPTEQSFNFSTSKNNSGHNLMRMISPPEIIAAGSSGSLSANFYAGPKDQYTLEEISSGLDLTVDYGWLWWIAQPLFWVLTFLQKYIGNWGVSIIALTVLIKAAFFQLSASSYRSMARLRTLAPKMQDLKDRYGDDRQKLSQATMELYKKEKVNPFGSCLPILIQMPVFIALYWVLMESVELRHAPFFGWIDDLSAMDPLFILPLLMGASMWFQQKLSPAPADPTQAKVLQWMPVIFTVLFLWFPAGLVLYWLTNNVLSIAQQWVITRNIEKAEAAKA